MFIYAIIKFLIKTILKNKKIKKIIVSNNANYPLATKKQAVFIKLAKIPHGKVLF